MMLILYHSGLTTCSKQVRHCLREKGLSYESRFVELSSFQNLNPAYLKLNPNGVVPTLVHDGAPIINSFCINEYIEDAIPEPPLLPADLKERARARYWAWKADEVHPSLARLTYAKFMLGTIDAFSEDDKTVMLEATPMPELKLRWRAVTQGGWPPEEMNRAYDNLLFALKRMEEELETRGPWLAGAAVSLGDISMAAIVHRTFEVDPARIARADFPMINDWWDRLMARPAAKYVYTPGLEETPIMPRTKSIAGITEKASPAGAT
jgi:glutathione S-transferase